MPAEPARRECEIAVLGGLDTTWPRAKLVLLALGHLRGRGRRDLVRVRDQSGSSPSQ